MHRNIISHKEIWEKAIRHWPTTGFFMSVALLSLHLVFSSPAQTEAAHPDPQLETLVPEGFQLIPIEIQNLESLDSVFGKFGHVDLYATRIGGSSPGERVAQAIKLIRAPLNPRHFAVLVHSELAPTIIRNGPSFFVSVQNLKKPGTITERPIAKTRSRIVVETE